MMRKPDVEILFVKHDEKTWSGNTFKNIVLQKNYFKKMLFIHLKNINLFKAFLNQINIKYKININQSTFRKPKNFKDKFKNIS